MRTRIFAASALAVLAILIGALPALAANKGQGTQPGGVIVGGHIESSVSGSTGKLCVNIDGEEICEDFGVQSGELHIVVPKNDVDNTFVSVVFNEDPGTSVAKESDGTICNRQLLAYTDVMTFCYRDVQPENGLDRFNLVIVQQSPQNRCEPERHGGDDGTGGVLKCSDPTGGKR